MHPGDRGLSLTSQGRQTMKNNSWLNGFLSMAMIATLGFLLRFVWTHEGNGIFVSILVLLGLLIPWIETQANL
jgi:hypothetical protein